jgi:catechol 2,3-dioxygenase-like lactoylglutathione lyase family enzyme
MFNRNRLGVIVCVLLASASVSAQAPAAAGPAPTGLVVGSGNFFSPIVADLDKAIAFYRDGLGLDVTGAPANADANPALRNMFGLPDAQLRWTIGRPPAMRTGVEIVEVKKIESRPIERRIQDSGAFTLIVLVRDIDSVFATLKRAGAPVVTTGGRPLAVGSGKTRAVIVKDPDGHFVELAQLDPPPPTTSPEAANVLGVRVRLTVDDGEKAMRLYRDLLGLQALEPSEFRSEKTVMNMMGLTSGGQYRVSTAIVPTTGLRLEFIDFKGVDRKTVQARIQDPGSTRMQLQVRDVDATIAALKGAGGSVVSAGGSTVELPGRGGATTKVAIVRDPNNLFLVLLQAAPPAPTVPKNP